MRNMKQIKIYVNRGSHNDQNGNETSHKYNQQNKVIADSSEHEIPSPPTNCCMSGCANCVWIEYAEKLASQLGSGTAVARQIIVKQVDDANMRAFLEMELRMLERTKGK